MVLKVGVPEKLCLQGEVVEIFEKEGERQARISVLTLNIIDVSGESLREAHLGDRVQIDAQLILERIEPE